MRAIFAFCVVAISGFALAADAPGDKRELLANHETVAQFKGVAFQRCMGRTSMCPDNCGHSGDFANFTIVGYTKYEKNGEYGDPKAETFSFQVQDNKKKPKAPKEIAEIAKGLKPDDYVILIWHHDYVTRTEAGGGQSKFPDRPIVKLEKITKEKADELLMGK